MYTRQYKTSVGLMSHKKFILLSDPSQAVKSGRMFCSLDYIILSFRKPITAREVLIIRHPYTGWIERLPLWTSGREASGRLAGPVPQ